MTEPNLGLLVDTLWQTREDLRVLSQQEKELKEKVDQLKQQIMTKLNELGTDQTRTAKATATVSTKDFATVSDWDAFYAYIHDNQAFHLLQKRPVSRAVIEELDAEGPIPGVDIIQQTDLGLRTNT